MKVTGKIIRLKDSTCGIFVHSIEFNLTYNIICGVVAYFPLERNRMEKEWTNCAVLDNDFRMPRDYFVQNFQFLENPDLIQDFSQAEWKDFKEVLGE